MADDQPIEGQDEKNWKELRKQADEAKAAQAEMEQMRRELAFAKAGIDTESKLGKMLFKTYDGELTNDAIKAEASEIGLFKEPEQQPRGEQISEDERAQSRVRSQLGNDAEAGPGDGEDPYVQAKRAWDEARNDGDPADVAAGAYLSHILQAAHAGDRRVFIEPN
jgi:hypothetical protein